MKAKIMAVVLLASAFLAGCDQAPIEDQAVVEGDQAALKYFEGEIPGSTCAKDPILGNVICTVCTGGPFPSCKDYICDANGQNCRPTLKRGTMVMPAMPVGGVLIAQ